MKKIFMCLLALSLFSGCMSEREYQLRKTQLENQRAHPAVYELFTVEGPVKVEVLQGGKVLVKVPGQPFKEISIPDGVESQKAIFTHLLNIGAISALGWKALDETGKNKSSSTISKEEGK